MWSSRAGFDIISAGNEHYMVKFDFLKDPLTVMEGGPWMINGYYLVLKQWFPQSNPLDPWFGFTIVWVR